MYKKILASLTPYQGKSEIVIVDQSVSDILNGIMTTHNEYKSDYDNIYQNFDANTVEEIACNIWDFLKTHVPYKIESENGQTLRSPAAILSLPADCKSYALFAAGIIDAFNRHGEKIDWCFRFSSYNNDKELQHVFVVIFPGTKNEIWIDPVLDRFNYHKSYTYKKDEYMLKKLSGINKNSTVARNATIEDYQGVKRNLYRKRIGNALFVGTPSYIPDSQFVRANNHLKKQIEIMQNPGTLYAMIGDDYSVTADPGTDPGTDQQIDPETGAVIDPETGLATDPQTGDTYDPETGAVVDPETGLAIDPQTGDTYDPETGAVVDPETGLAIDPQTGDTYDPETGAVVDPETGLAIDPQTGDTYDPETGAVVDPETGLATDPDTGKQYDPETGGEYDPTTGLCTDPQTGQLYDPETGGIYDPETGYCIDPETGKPYDPETGAEILPNGLAVDPDTGKTYDPQTGLEVDPKTGMPTGGKVTSGGGTSGGGGGASGGGGSNTPTTSKPTPPKPTTPLDPVAAIKKALENAKKTTPITNKNTGQPISKLSFGTSNNFILFGGLALAALLLIKKDDKPQNKQL